MPLSTQVQMLRVLEMREVTPLGTNEVRPVDLRVVAASKVDLGHADQRAVFREDLYYRLNVVTLTIPPLRERREDVPLLFQYFARKAGRRFGREIPAMPQAVVSHLREHQWPGNVRELSHYAERFVLGLEPSEPVPVPGSASFGSASLPDRLERFEADIIRETLTECGGDVQQTIAALGIPRKTFYDKLQRHGIVRSEYADRG
jgi:two-component system, NtrC family, C4-dicarboxylate transport response regulator DctD